MKKRILVLIWLIAGYGVSGIAWGQGGQIQFQFKGVNRSTHVEALVINIVHDTAVSEAFDYLKTSKDERFNMNGPVSPIMLGVRLNPTLRNTWMPDVSSMSKSYRSYNIPDSSEAIVIALGITKDNAKDYRYRVVENDSTELVKWSPISVFQQNFGAEKPYGFIGKFKAINKQLMIEVVNINNYSIREGVIFNWHVNFKPILSQINIMTPGPLKTYMYPTEVKDPYPTYFNINATGVNRGMATKFDKETNVPLDMSFTVDSISSITLQFKSHPAVAYAIYLVKNIGAVSDTTNISNSFSNEIYPISGKFFNQPGKYELIIQRVGPLNPLKKWPEEQKLKIPFVVKPPPLTEKKVAIKQLIPYTVATLCGVAFLFFMYRRQSKGKLERAAQDKQMVSLKLRSIRAQLNPHFMFNALTSIQNLVNKNDIAGANHYLSKFAGLTREVLDTGNDELLSMEQELKILDDYLQMEQLRFGFRYEIIADDGLNIANIDIPAMLLQPFVENAVKHGVASLQADGKIEVRIMKEGKDILLTVKDNGKGFAINRHDEKESYGLKLSEERVALLNQLYKEQPVSLHIDAQTTGTVVSIRLSNWI
ncbi:sensor histidine kinase [Mucilaginibacter lappiensis]|uniref:Histidine kinase n=1 Tax=Mucilaginibacter lappiensis TaxID=354630 RepID=A0A841JQD9_9SPHI|nr:histidine kinase [Mucilaginibacter lappiensis]MBB6130081.1 hypothetical protein [Mucilaginibacter lappiensis]